MSRITIGFLADDVAAVGELRGWFESEWHEYYGPGGPGDADSDLRLSQNRSRLPIALVAYIDGQACGTGALKAESIATHRHLSPWIAGLLVVPRFRRRGVAGRLIDELETLAWGLGYEKIHCATSTVNGMLERRAWQRIEEVSLAEDRVVVYAKSL